METHILRPNTKYRDNLID